MNYWLWLSTFYWIGSVKLQSLLKRFKGPSSVFFADKKELIHADGITEKIANKIYHTKDQDLILNMEEYMKLNQIFMTHIGDEKFPAKLLNMYDPPIVLFYKGNIDLANTNTIGVIGSRRASEYGKKITFKIGRELAEKGFTIVSGLAKGADSEAHKGALAISGNTLAVVATGLDMVYPTENVELCKKIERKGLVLSEYPVGIKVNQNNFLERNRIISGLSDKLIVTEASLRSGTMSTVDRALEQGKDVYAVPGNVYSLMSEGTNKLIQNGAFIYTKSEDIF